MSESAPTRKPATKVPAKTPVPKITGVKVAKKTTTKKTARAHTPRVPKAASLLVYLEEYLEASGIGADKSISAVIDKLKDSIVAESTAKIRN